MQLAAVVVVLLALKLPQYPLRHALRFHNRSGCRLQSPKHSSHACLFSASPFATHQHHVVSVRKKKGQITIGVRHVNYTTSHFGICPDTSSLVPPLLCLQSATAPKIWVLSRFTPQKVLLTISPISESSSVWTTHAIRSTNQYQSALVTRTPISDQIIFSKLGHLVLSTLAVAFTSTQCQRLLQNLRVICHLRQSPSQLQCGFQPHSTEEQSYVVFLLWPAIAPFLQLGLVTLKSAQIMHILGLVHNVQESLARSKRRGIRQENRACVWYDHSAQ